MGKEGGRSTRRCSCGRQHTAFFPSTVLCLLHATTTPSLAYTMYQIVAADPSEQFSYVHTQGELISFPFFTHNFVYSRNQTKASKMPQFANGQIGEIPKSVRKLFNNRLSRRGPVRKSSLQYLHPVQIFADLLYVWYVALGRWVLSERLHCIVMVSSGFADVFYFVFMPLVSVSVECTIHINKYKQTCCSFSFLALLCFCSHKNKEKEQYPIFSSPSYINRVFLLWDIQHWSWLVNCEERRRKGRRGRGRRGETERMA